MQKYIQQASRTEAKYFANTVFSRADGKCEVCALFCPWILTIHHIIPVANGGSGYPDNLIALCPNCHEAVEKCKVEKYADNPYFSEWIWDTYGNSMGGDLVEVAYSSGFDDWQLRCEERRRESVEFDQRAAESEIYWRNIGPVYP